MPFNIENANTFFEALRIKEEVPFKTYQIYNLDETNVSTVATETPKIITPTEESVGKLASAKRGSNVTTICCINSNGLFVPPFLIFLKVRMQSSLTNNTLSVIYSACKT